MDEDSPTEDAPFIASGVDVARRSPWAWPALGILAVSLLGLGVHLADELIEGERFRLDSAILLALRVPGQLDRPIGPAWLEQSAIDLSALGGFTVMTLFGGAAIAFLFFARRRAEAAWIALSLLGSAAIDGALKHWIGRPRPELVPHLAQVADPSFPSGHAMISAAVYLTLALMLAEAERALAARIALVGFFSLIVLLIGTSRIFLGVHWPSDVLAGWCFGAVWALLIFAANRWAQGRLGEPAPE